MLNTNIKLYGLNDISIIPARVSDVEHRSDVNPYYTYRGNENTLPVFASPMGCVVNIENLKCWHTNGIIPIIPRTIDITTRLSFAKHNGEWIAMGLDEFENYVAVNTDNTPFANTKVYKDINSLFSSDNKESNLFEDFTESKELEIIDFYDGASDIIEMNVLIDVANGHMQKIIDLIAKARETERIHKDVIKLNIMMGNVANPEYIRYILHNYVEIDYIRMSVGTGSCCITSAESAIHYPMASLISKSKEIIEEFVINDYTAKNFRRPYPKIIADGGIRTYADAIKCLALGADYVMIGTAFAALYESASDFYTKCSNVYSKTLSCTTDKFKYMLTPFAEDERIRWIESHPRAYKRNYGMSTPEAQQNIDPNKKVKLTEGIARYIECKKTIKQWTDEFTGYLRSCMSYTSSKSLYALQHAECVVISNNAYNAINKPVEI